MPRRFEASKFGLDHLKATAEKCKNRGRRGPEDEVGTLNFITPESIAGAARLVRRGKVFSLGLNFDRQGPQRGLWGNRYNPIHTMLATGTDAVPGNQDAGGLRYADDCARDRAYEFFFCGPPLPITGAVGSPINPQAIK